PRGSRHPGARPRRIVGSLWGLDRVRRLRYGLRYRARIGRLGLGRIHKLHFLDHNGLQRRIRLERTKGAGGGHSDSIDDIHALYDATEYRVTPTGRQGIEIGVVDQIDIDLGVARVRRLIPRQSHHAALVLQAVAGLIEDGLVYGLELIGGGVMSAALDHEVRHDTMEESIGVEAFLDVP